MTAPPLPLHHTHAAIGREDDHRRERRLQRAIQVGEALDVQHVHLVDEQHARNQLRHAVLDILVHHTVHLLAQLLRDLCLALAHQLVHQTRQIVTALRLRVRHVQIVERHVLNHLLLLEHLALGDRNVLVRLQIVLRRVASCDERTGDTRPNDPHA